MKPTASLAMAAILIAAISLEAQKKAQAAAGSEKPKAAAMKMETKVETPDKLDWQPAKRFPAGAQVAVLEGNPMKAGPYTMRLKTPDGYKIPPHWHAGPEHVTVLQGEVSVGMGGKWDDSKMNTIPAQTFALIPAHQQHYAQTKGDTIIQIHGMGPWSIHYVNPTDDPEHKGK
jgi:anti-sigma factor ChrR (cupin superfamily)